LVQVGKMRTDLHARLEGFTVDLPPLADRREDLGLILSQILSSAVERPMVSLKPEAGLALCTFDWPLNIRELALCMSRALALATDGVVGKHHLPARISKSGEGSSGGSEPPEMLSEEDERIRAELLAKLSEHRGNISKIAQDMGKARMQVQRWMKRFHLSPDDYRKG
jgi:DNA-binding NtrC family response regulator